MKIEEGKYYRRRRGDVVGPAMYTAKYASHPWSLGVSDYTDEGRFYADERKSEYDLIEECNADGTPVTSEPIVDNRTLLKKAMREGLPVKSSESFDSYFVTAIGNNHFLCLTNGGLGNEGQFPINTEGGWQIVEPEITAEDLCEAIYTARAAYGTNAAGSSLVAAQELAEKYRKQQEQK